MERNAAAHPYLYLYQNEQSDGLPLARFYIFPPPESLLPARASSSNQRASMLHPYSESDEEDEKTRQLKRSGGEKRCRDLTKQHSIRERRRELRWEKRKKQMQLRNRFCEKEEEEDKMNLTDEDLQELRGSIELGFGFNEDNGGHDLCKTLPALNLYFAVNRQVSDPKLRLSSSPMSSPTSPFGHINGSSSPADAWKIFSPGDSPQEVKTRLKHWAQAVACSLKQSS